MALPSGYTTTTCDIYRPYGAASPTTTGVACRLVADLPRGQSAAGGLYWSHYLDVTDTVDLRDACTRLAGVGGVTYADGDEVRIPGATGSRFVVVWVEMVHRGTTRQFKRAYLVRDTAVWPGP